MVGQIRPVGHNLPPLACSNTKRKEKEYFRDSWKENSILKTVTNANQSNATDLLT